MSIGMPIRFEDGGSLARLDLKLFKLSNPNMLELMETIGSEVESQTVKRISEEKKAPDGSEWADWSEGYAGTQHGRKQKHKHPGQLRSAGGHSLLELEGDLLKSIAFEVEGTSDVLIGSNLEYARAVNSDRQYLGLSSQNEADLERVVNDFFEDLLR